MRGIRSRVLFSEIFFSVIDSFLPERNVSYMKETKDRSGRYCFDFPVVCQEKPGISPAKSISLQEFGAGPASINGMDRFNDYGSFVWTR